ncbi:MAG: hypothetical protein RXR82_06070 [Nitrososphaeria archaeon]
MSLTQKAKAWSLTHVVSIMSLMISDISYNALFFYYVGKAAGALGLLWTAFVNIAYAAGMYYYAAKVAATAQGITVEESGPKSTQ